MYERNRGRKRGRDDAGLDSVRQMLLDLLRIGDSPDQKSGQPNDEMIQPAPIEQQIEDAVKELKSWINLGDRNKVQMMLLDCVCEVTTKTLVYASMIGLLNCEDRSFISEFLSQCVEMFGKAMEACQFHICRLLIRFFGCLMLVNVLQPSDITNLFSLLVKTALMPLEGGSSVPSVEQDYRDPHVWQLWSDMLVYWVLIAFPWVGEQLSNFAPSELDALFEQIAKYVEVRPLKFSEALRPFYCAKGEGDIAAKSDSGGYSFLSELFDAVKELKEVGWKLDTVKFVHQKFEAKLGCAEPHSFAEIKIGLTCPGLPPNLSLEQKSALIRQKIPPRGGIKLLPSARMPERLSIERIIVEEYILDIVNCFESDKLECARQLTQNIPVPFPIGAILTETIVSQMLRLPESGLKPVMYQSLLLYFVQLGQQEFPKHIGGCVRELYNRLGVLDLELRQRFIDWLAYHLSNFGFFWPWSKWEKVLTQPPSNQQRQFCQGVLRNLVQLSYYDRVKKSLEDGQHAAFFELLPPSPEINQIQPSAIKDENNVEDVDMDGTGQIWIQVAEDLRELLANKRQSSEVKQWIIDQDLGSKLGANNSSILKLVLWVILIHGSKSYTHTSVMVDRYKDLLSFLMGQVEGIEGSGEVQAVQGVFIAWRNAPQRILMCVEQLLTVGLVSGNAVSQWVVQAKEIRNVDDEIMLQLSHKLLNMAVSHSYDACEYLSQELRAAADELYRAQAMAEEASQFAAAAQARQDVDSFAEQEAAERERESLEKVMELEKKVQFRKENLEQAIVKQDNVAGTMILKATLMAKDSLIANNQQEQDQKENENLWGEHCFRLLKTLCRKFHAVLASMLPNILQKLQQEQIPETIVSAVQEYVKI